MQTTNIQSSERTESGPLNGSEAQGLPASTAFSDIFSMMKAASELEGQSDILVGELPKGLVEGLPVGLMGELPKGLTGELPPGLLGELPQGLMSELPPGLLGELPKGLSAEMPVGLSALPLSALDVSTQVSEESEVVVEMAALATVGSNAAVEPDLEVLAVPNLGAQIFRAGGEAPAATPGNSLQELVTQLAARAKPTKDLSSTDEKAHIDKGVQNILATDSVAYEAAELVKAPPEKISPVEVAMPLEGGNVEAELLEPVENSEQMILADSEVVVSEVHEEEINPLIGFGDSDVTVEEVDSSLVRGLAPHEVDPEVVYEKKATVEQAAQVSVDSETAELAQINGAQMVEQNSVKNSVNSTVQSASAAASQPSVQVNNTTSHASANSVTNWGSQSTDGQAAQTSGQAGQQAGQGGQNGQGQPSQQQAMMFAQAAQEGKERAVEQQQAVRAVDEALAKSETRELLGGAEIASSDRRAQLPLGLQTISLPVKHPQWGQAFGQRVVFMANNNLQQAQITLNPENLGKIQVVLKLDKDQVMNVTLTAQNGTTRESMENALPRLREMLEQAGVNLGSVDVNDQKQFSEDNPEQSGQKASSLDTNLAEDGSQDEDSPTTIQSTDSLVDYYV